MGTLYIDRRDTELRCEQGQLVVREPGGTMKGFPLRGLERVVVTGNARLDARVLTQLCAQGVGLLFLERRNARHHAFITGSQGSGARRLGQYRLSLDSALALRWARLWVRGRIRQLERFHRMTQQGRPDLRQHLQRCVSRLRSASGSLAAVSTISSLRGVEGAAAAAHFEAYANLLPPAFGFSGRNRRPPRDPVNAALSLGYTLTHADALRALLAAGLDPMLGTLHATAAGREPLACDLNELARVHVESMVWRLFADKHLRNEHFESSGNAVLLNKSGRLQFWSAYEHQASTHRRIFRSAVAALARHCDQLAAGQP